MSKHPKQTITPKTGRPEKLIDWDLVDQLLLAGCHGTEIAPYFDMHHDTFYRRVEEKFNVSFTAYSQQKKFQGDGVLRKAQFDKAISGDNTMLVWLGKNRLNQKETSEVTVAPETVSAYNTIMKQVEELQEARKRLKTQEEVFDGLDSA